MKVNAPIGIFDSGFGGLTIMKEIVASLPAYDYIYMGDNARAPYGTRSFDTVYEYTLQAVKWFFKQNSPLVIIACNTASAKALRQIQQKDLPTLSSTNRVLGIVRPTCEVIGNYSKSKSIGIMATAGTVQSESYIIEIAKYFPSLTVEQQSCPMWVPLVENGAFDSEGADYFIKKDIEALLGKNENIDTILLACTHYPLLIEKIKKYLPEDVAVIAQGKIVAASLADYLIRHKEMSERISSTGKRTFYTTESTEKFDTQAALFYGDPIQSKHIKL